MAVNNTPKEEVEQIKFCTWLTNSNIAHYAIPNGGYRHMVEAVKLKRSGVQRGVPDLCIPIPRGKYHGLYIEMKRQKGGVLSDGQLYWLTLLRDQGYFAEIANGYEEGRCIVERYLELKVTI